MSRTIEMMENTIESRSLDVSDVIVRSNYTTITATDGAGLQLAVTSFTQMDGCRMIVEDIFNDDNIGEFSYNQGDDITVKLGDVLDEIIQNAEE